MEARWATGHDIPGRIARLTLCGIVGVAYGIGGICWTAARAVLDDVGELVRDEPASGGGLRSVAAFIEDDVSSNGIGVGVYCASRLGGQPVIMNLHVAEIVLEAHLHVAAGALPERLAGCSQDLVYDRGDALLWLRSRGKSLQRLLLLSAVLTFAPRDSVLSARAPALQRSARKRSRRGR